jgi:hypothetical protein
MDVCSLILLYVYYMSKPQRDWDTTNFSSSVNGFFGSSGFLDFFELSFGFDIFMSAGMDFVMASFGATRFTLPKMGDGSKVA